MSGKDAGEFAAYTMNNFKLNIEELEKLGNQINFLDDKMSMVNGRDIFNTLSRTSGSVRYLGLQLLSKIHTCLRYNELKKTMLENRRFRRCNSCNKTFETKEKVFIKPLDLEYLQNEYKAYITKEGKDE